MSRAFRRPQGAPSRPSFPGFYRFMDCGPARRRSACSWDCYGREECASQGNEHDLAGYCEFCLWIQELITHIRLQMTREHNILFRAHVPSLVAALEDADSGVRETAKTTIIEIFQCVAYTLLRSVAYTDFFELQKCPISSQVRPETPTVRKRGSQVYRCSNSLKSRSFRP